MVVEKEGYGWVDKNLTFTEALTLSSVADQADPPFKALEIKGDQTGSDSNVYLDWEGTGMVQLNDNDTFGKSAAIYFKIGDNWRAKVGVLTNNGDYFTDNLKNSFLNTDMVEVQEVGLLSQSSIATGMGFEDTFWDTQLNAESAMAVAMTGGDYMSIDIDEEFADIYRFRLKINGSFVNTDDPEEFDANTYIGLLKLEHYEELGTGSDEDIDNDQSVLDPFNPEDIEFEGGNGGDGDFDGTDPCPAGYTLIGGTCVKDEDPPEDEEDYSVFLVVGAIGLVLVGSYLVLTRGGV